MNHFYEGYVVPVHLPVDAFAGMLRTDGVDLTQSYVALEDEEPVAMGLIARRDKISRLAAFAVDIKLRGKGIGKWFLGELLDEAKDRKDREMVLEVITTNDSAVKLYERSGFARKERLVGYGFSASAEEPMGDNSPIAGLHEADMADLVAAILASGLEWPWQMSAETLAQMAWPNRAWQYESGYVCTSDLAKSVVLIRGLAGDENDLAGLMTALLKQFPGRSWRLLPVMPEGIYSGLFERLGFYTDKLSQWKMGVPFLSR